MQLNVSFVHGAWGNPGTMKTLAAGLQHLTSNPVTSIQLVGHGSDTFTPQMGNFGLNDYEANILEQLPSDRNVIVGFSMGAACAFRLAQKYPERIKGVVMIDPPMLGGGADIRVTKALMSKPFRYIHPILTNGLFIPTRDDAKMMLYNGEESPHLDSIVRQPASGRVIREMLFGRLPTQSRRPCGLVIARKSRLHPEKSKIKWAQQVHANCLSVDDSHCGILENPSLPHIVHGLIQRVSI